MLGNLPDKYRRKVSEVVDIVTRSPVLPPQRARVTKNGTIIARAGDKYRVLIQKKPSGGFIVNDIVSPKLVEAAAKWKE